jgi:hypothetical protein
MTHSNLTAGLPLTVTKAQLAADTFTGGGT